MGDLVFCRTGPLKHLSKQLCGAISALLNGNLPANNSNEIRRDGVGCSVIFVAIARFAVEPCSLNEVSPLLYIAWLVGAKCGTMQTISGPQKIIITINECLQYSTITYTKHSRNKKFCYFFIFHYPDQQWIYYAVAIDLLFFIF